LHSFKETSGLVTAGTYHKGDMLQSGMLESPPGLQSGYREVAIIVDAETGVGIMQMEAGLDTGPVGLERRTPISATDTAADPDEFGTAFTAASTVESLAKQGNTLTTTYVYLLGNSGMEASDIVSEISNALKDGTGTARVSSYLEQDDNPRIVTVIDDQTVTVQTAYLAGFVALVLIAYVLSVLTADNIRRQSPVIGTFYALGITRRELVVHYMLLPVILAAVCAIIGTVGGFLTAPAMQNATTYYSIPALSSVASPDVIAYGVLTPLVTVTLVSFLVLRSRLAKEPLQLLHRDTGQRPPSRATLESLPFAFSFRLRSFMRAWTTYVLMLLGVVLSLLLMVFSFGMHDSVVSYADDVRDRWLAVLDESGRFTLQNFATFFSKPYYSRTILNSFELAVLITLCSLLIGIPFSYF